MSTRLADGRRRFAARRRRAALGPLRRALPALAAAGAVSGLGYLALGSGALSVHSVEVSGTHRLTAAQVRAAVADVLHDPLLTVDIDHARSSVLAIPGVDHVDVQRAWPSQLRVTVVERVPVATVHRADGWWLVDAAGVVFGPPGERVRGLLPLRLPATGAQASADRPPAAAAALRVISALPPDLRHQVVSVAASSGEDVRLELSSGSTVVWGSVERSADKARILRTLIRSKASVYDVSSPTVVTTR